jgi:chemotaxis response regulator CheB
MGPEKRARILLADDHADALARGGQVLGRHWDIAGTVSNGVELVAVAARLDPDVIVLDIAMPLMDGLKRPAPSGRAATAARFVFLTVGTTTTTGRSRSAWRRRVRGQVRLASDLVAAVRPPSRTRSAIAVRVHMVKRTAVIAAAVAGLLAGSAPVPSSSTPTTTCRSRRASPR